MLQNLNRIILTILSSIFKNNFYYLCLRLYFYLLTMIAIEICCCWFFILDITPNNRLLNRD